MSNRVKVLGAFAFIGFLTGNLAYSTYKHVFPLLSTLIPELLSVTWFLSGVGGSIMTLIIVVIWASIKNPILE